MPDLFEAAWQAVANCRIALVGDVVLDAYVYGETARVSREAPVLVVRKQRQEERLGAGANTAVNLTAIGVQTLLVGEVGEDAAGARLRELLSLQHVDVEHLYEGRRCTPLKTRILAGAVGTSKQQVLRVDDEPRQDIDAETQRQVIEAIERIVERCDAIVVSDYGTGVVTPAVRQVLCDLAMRGASVFVDSRYNFSDYRGVTAVTPNLPEAEALTGLHIDSHDAVHAAGQSILERVQCGACLLKQGRGGMTLFRPESSSIHVEIVGSDEVTDVTGAGDTVVSTFTAAVSAGLGWRNATVLANAAAGVVVNKLGCATASPAEVTRALREEGLFLEAWQ